MYTPHEIRTAIRNCKTLYELARFAQAYGYVAMDFNQAIRSILHQAFLNQWDKVQSVAQ